jgi:hypothetical protein
MDTVLLSMLPFLVALAFILYQTARRVDGVAPRCSRCGYDPGPTACRCPECGTAAAGNEA